MTSRAKKTQAPKLSLKDAFEVEFARREMERRAREEAERRQQEEDMGRATALYQALKADPKFLQDHELSVDQRRYTVALDHRDFRISAYFEAGLASVTSADKRTPSAGATAPRKQVWADTVEEALAAVAQLLVDETR